jgi:16S rRNA A1518/A1519 N6-dimethyltransferase RsmA/KsgA/DIM1 with predicted DNA glycosylase/AP lyase activity
MNQSTYNLEDQDRMRAASNYNAWQSRLVRSELGRRVVEVGCGVGNFTGTLLECEAVLAVDREPEHRAAAAALRGPAQPAGDGL